MLLCQLGFGNVWTEQSVGEDDSFIFIFSQKVSDVSIQKWHSEVSNSSKLRTYCQFKSVLEEEKYITNLNIFKFRKTFTNFRISCHSLRVETGRYDNTPIHENISHFSFQKNKLLIDDEYHLDGECPN